MIFWKKNDASQKLALDSFHSIKTTDFALCVHFEMHDSETFFLYQILNWMFYSVSDLELKVLCLVGFWIDKFFVLLDSEWNFLQFVGLWHKFSTNCQIYCKKFSVFEGKFLPKSTTWKFGMVFPHNTRSSYSLQNPHPRENSNGRWNNNFCTLFHKDF